MGSDGRQAAAADSAWTRDRLATELNRLITEVDPDLDATAAVVEFLVGFNMLDDDFESLPVGLDNAGQALGVTFPVVVRSLDRLTDPDWRQPWQDKWKALAACGDAYDDTAICWVESAPAPVAWPRWN